MTNAEKTSLCNDIKKLNINLPREQREKKLIELLGDYAQIKLGGAVLKEIFLYLCPPDEDGFTKEVSIDYLVKFNPGFRTTNGGDWCRSDASSLGKEFVIKRIQDKGKIVAVKLEGKNKKHKINQGIRKDILEIVKKERCAILDISTSIECDHKDGKKDDWRMNSMDEQKLGDFQPLCKTANDAKRSHCKTCKETGKRYDARILGYAVAFTKGDENTANCQGCYWYDPKKFNAEISKDFNKKR